MSSHHSSSNHHHQELPSRHDETPVQDNRQVKHMTSHGSSHASSTARRRPSEQTESDFDALAYFTANDPAESKLLQELEDTAAATALYNSNMMTSPKSSRRPPKGHRRGASKKMQNVAKQLSIRQKLGQREHSNRDLMSNSSHHNNNDNHNNGINTYGSYEDRDNQQAPPPPPINTGMNGSFDVDQGRSPATRRTSNLYKKSSHGSLGHHHGHQLSEVQEALFENSTRELDHNDNPLMPPPSIEQAPLRNRAHSMEATGSHRHRSTAQRRRSSKFVPGLPTSDFVSTLADNLEEDPNDFGDFLQHVKKKNSGGTGRHSNSLNNNNDQHKRTGSNQSHNNDQGSNHNSNSMPSPIMSSPAASRRHRRQRTTTDALYDHAQHLESLFSEGPQDNFDDMKNGDQGQESGDADDLSDISDNDDDGENGGRDLEGGPDVRRPLLPGRRQHQRQPISWTKRIYNSMLSLFYILGPADIWNGILYFLLYRFLMVVVPLLGFAFLCFYGLGRPQFNFLPLGTYLSWWCIFIVRLFMTYSLAEVSQYVMEILTTRTTIIVRVAGPLMALVAMQSLGWPYLIASWGAWTMLIMRGEHPFCKHWLYFLNIRIFTQTENPDQGILDSEIWWRILLAMIFVGTATAAKRTMVALYLSRRMLQYYRKQLRELLADMKVVMEVAELAAETENEDFLEILAQETKRENSTRSREGSVAGRFVKKSNSNSKLVPSLDAPTPEANLLLGEFSVDNDDDEDDDDDDDDDEMEDSDDEPGSPSAFRQTAFSPLSLRNNMNQNPVFGGTSSAMSAAGSIRDGPIQWNELKNKTKAARSLRERSMSPIEMAASAGEVQRQHRARASSNRLEKLMPKLENWEEPETVASKKAIPSLHEILQFRKAMQFMENPYPFSTAFGPARTRKECIKSSGRTYKRLLRFTPGETVLDYNIIGATAYDDQGNPDEKRARALIKVFLPEKDNELHQLAFVQSVDYVYKSLRFLRASILNSSKIDSVLEDVFDVVFNICLGLMVISLCGLNPVPMLLSFSTVMVSLAFSFGPSCAKYIEGILMIAVRRPFDIGDRITINGGETLAQPTSSDTWLVEDITLSTTTLRFAATNEVSSINNAAIANSRIANGARSNKAIVSIYINFNVKSTQEQIEMFRIRVENFLVDRPEIWSGLAHFRNDAVDQNNDMSRYLLRIQHQKSWQDMPPVMVHKGELERYINKVAVDLGIQWQSSHHRIRVVEVPPIKTGPVDDEDAEKEVGKVQEPFMQFMKAETGTGF